MATSIELTVGKLYVHRSGEIFRFHGCKVNGETVFHVPHHPASRSIEEDAVNPASHFVRVAAVNDVLTARGRAVWAKGDTTGHELALAELGYEEPKETRS